MKKGNTNESGHNMSGKKSTPPATPVPVEDLSDELLMRAISMGVVWGLETLIERYQRLLYALAYRMVADHQVAEEVLQDSFISVWHNASTYTSHLGGVRSWLIAIVRHRAIDYLRRKRSHTGERIIGLQDAQEQEADAPELWEQAWRACQGRQVRQALSLLSKEQRTVIELAYFQGWTHTEIAAGCHLPLGTVKARMRLGLLHLRNILEEMGGETLR